MLILFENKIGYFTKIYSIIIGINNDKEIYKTKLQEIYSYTSSASTESKSIITPLSRVLPKFT